MGTLVRFPAGIVLMTWRYIWRVTALHRNEAEGDAGDLPPPLPAEWTDECTKTLADGSGPMFHRCFRVLIEGSSMSPEGLMEAVCADMNRAAPSTVAVFHKTVGEKGAARLGDEYRVQMPGPWDGPVRVIAQDATNLGFSTLRGHLEAGQIHFRTRTDESGLLVFEIEAWSRAGGILAALLYSRLRVAKEIQLNMWVHFCLQTVRIAGGHPRRGVRIDTRSIPLDLCRNAPNR